MFERLIEILLAAWRALIPWVVLAEYERGVVLRLGRAHRDLGPGLHLVWPLAEVVLYDSVITDTVVLPSQALTTADGHAVSVQPLLVFEVQDIRRMLLSVADRDRALHDCAAGVIANRVVRSAWEHVKTPQFLEEVTALIRARTERYGFALSEVQLVGLQKTRSLMLMQQHKYE